MKRVIWLCLFSLFAVPALTQQRGGFGAGLGRGGTVAGGFGHGRFRGGGLIGGFGFPSQGFVNLGIPPVGPIPPLGMNAPFFGFDHRFGFHHRLFSSSGFFPYAFPLFAGSYDYGYAGYAPEPSIIIVQQPSPQVIVQQAPPAPVRSEIHDYKEPAPLPTTPPIAKGEEVTFLIALNDGSVHAASAVWVQDKVLHYIDSDDRHHEVPLQSVDRALTRRLNRERKLDLWLPAAQ